MYITNKTIIRTVVPDLMLPPLSLTSIDKKFSRRQR